MGLFFARNPTTNYRGIILLWRRDLVQLTIPIAMDQLVLRQISISQHKNWMVDMVYANKDYSIKMSQAMHELMDFM